MNRIKREYGLVKTKIRLTLDVNFSCPGQPSFLKLSTEVELMLKRGKNWNLINFVFDAF